MSGAAPSPAGPGAPAMADLPAQPRMPARPTARPWSLSGTW